MKIHGSYKRELNLGYLLFALALWLLVSCDQGFEMDPAATLDAATSKVWTKQFNGFELEANKIRGLIGEQTIRAPLFVSTGAKPITIETAELITEQGVYTAQISEQSKVIPAFSNHSPIWAIWLLNKYDGVRNRGAAKILGEASRIVIHFKIDGHEVITVINYKKVK